MDWDPIQNGYPLSTSSNLHSSFFCIKIERITKSTEETDTDLEVVRRYGWRLGVEEVIVVEANNP